MSDLDARIRASFARQSMMTSLGATLVSVAPGAVEIGAPIGAAHLQQHGFAHAGLTFSVGDSAAGYAALSILPEGREVVTSEIGIHLLAPARGDRLIARGRIIKPGRRLIVVASDVYAIADGRETHVATLQGTMVPVDAG
ncbi:Thioesterase superfamily protein [Roseivivax sp. THAF40]|uniref:PaaI family thioesterase n=1 Tax=unclassified Roseivivax TaxID=2639302 RepID=UPI001268CBDD|nr:MULTISPECIES: PaaI family thioesterase [unclassified Roseivivax]QFS84215.1 Thioesterase superfamily protein [Roseivivax sp. THAF197b]QFT48043.1 Thioesterase superfamily protein [Roseivivax sp. THAF40]